MLYYALMLLFAIGLIVSVGMGVHWFKDAGIDGIADPGRASAESLRSAAKGPTLTISGQRPGAASRQFPFGTSGLERIFDGGPIASIRVRLK